MLKLLTYRFIELFSYRLVVTYVYIYFLSYINQNIKYLAKQKGSPWDFFETKITRFENKLILINRLDHPG